MFQVIMVINWNFIQSKGYFEMGVNIKLYVHNIK